MTAMRPIALHRLPRAERGLSLVELLVTMAITLIATVIIFQVFEVSEGIKRTTSTGGDAQQNGAIALYVMERDLRNAGMGINESGLGPAGTGGCNLVGYDSTRAPTDFPAVGDTLLFEPLRIAFGASAAVPDQVVVMYGAQSHVGTTTLNANAAAASTELRVQGRYGVRTGDLIVIAEPGTAKSCVLREVTNLPVAPNTDAIQHGTDPYDYLVAASSGGGSQSKNTRFNKGGGLPAAYEGAGTGNVTKVFNLGNRHDGRTMPTHITYAIAGGVLTSASLFEPGVTNSVADNIVHMKAEYRMSDGTFSTSATPVWANVVGIRLAVLARSQLAERPSSGLLSDPCDATPVAPSWAGGTFTMTNTIGVGEDWKCYRYRVFETTVPLRNKIWSSS